MRRKGSNSFAINKEKLLIFNYFNKKDFKKFVQGYPVNEKEKVFIQPFYRRRCYKRKKAMEQSVLYTICGYVASIGLILGFLPQAITTIRTRNTDGISVPAFLMMAIGAFAFMLQGLLHRPNIIWSMLITNAVTGTCSCIIFIIKIYNDRKKRETGI